MADIEAMVQKAYDHFGKGDLDGLLAMFHDDAMFYVGGDTQVSGDRPKAKFGDLVGAVMQLSGGTFKEDILDIYTSAHGAAVVLKHHLERDGESLEYHTIHVWDVKGDKFSAWWEYPHEFDVFQRAWR